MPAPGPVPWARVEHTAAKHDIYRRYLHRWFPILLADRSYPRATYAEGFAGPGIYSGGEEGSPIIALRAYLDEVSNTGASAGFLFIDDDERCVDRLKAELVGVFLRRPRDDHAMPVFVRHGKCEELLEYELDHLGAWGMPILAVLDSWGNAPISYRLLRRIAANVSSEVVITFEPQHFVRFVSELGDDADDVFGADPSWRDAAELPSSEKRRHILQCYQGSLARAGFRFLLDFELVDRRGNSLYLVFGTNHPLGVQKMKDSLWEVDRVHGVGFRDPKDQDAETLFDVIDPQLAPLTRLLLARLTDGEALRVEQLRQFALFETVFRPEHVIRALRVLLAGGKIELDGGGRDIRRASFVKAAPTQSTSHSRPKEPTIPAPRGARPRDDATK